MSLAEVLSAVNSFPSQHCVITGGEPMLADQIHELSAGLRERGKHITIETAATIPPGGIECDLASLSPKLSNSVPDERLPDISRVRHDKIRWQPAIIREWIENYPYQLKFVMSSTGDFEELHQLLGELDLSIPPAKILLMPEGTSNEMLREGAEV